MYNVKCPSEKRTGFISAVSIPVYDQNEAILFLPVLYYHEYMVPTDTLTSQQNTTDGQAFVAEALKGFQNIFVIVGHSEEKAKEHATLMLERMNQIALTLLLLKRSEKTREALIPEMSHTKNLTELQTLIAKEFTQEERAEALAEATHQLMKAYFDEIRQDLTPDQTQAIQELLLSFITTKEAS